MKATLCELEAIYKKCRGSHRDRIKQIIERGYEVKDNLTTEELELIWYIRQINSYGILRLLRLVEKMYDAETEFAVLNNVMKHNAIDKK